MRHAENGAPKTRRMLVTGVSRVVEIGLLMVGATAGLTGEWHANAHRGQAAESKAVCAGEMTRLVESTRWKCPAATICANASASAISSMVALRRRFPLPVDGLEVVTGLAPAPSERFTSNGANRH